jgi:hypothetical protein
MALQAGARMAALDQIGDFSVEFFAGQPAEKNLH